MDTQIISLAKRKGGTGASSVTIMLATTLAKYAKKKVLILDTDDQRTIADLAEIEQAQDLNLLVDVEQVHAAKAQAFLKRWASDYDIVFIDFPRMTNLENDDKLVMLMYLCDSLLMPIVPSQFAVLSTIRFLDVAFDVVEQRKQLEFDTKLHGFLSLSNKRKDTQDARRFFEGKGLSMFDAEIANLKLYTRLSLSRSVMDTAEGRRRFEPFYNEFLSKFEING